MKKNKPTIKKYFTPKKSKKQVGLPPGSIVFIGEQQMEEPKVHHLQYDSEKISEVSALAKDANVVFRDDGQIEWFDIRGLHHAKLVESIGKEFNIHPLVLEDIVDTDQRPKFEEYENGGFLILKALLLGEEGQVEFEQVAIFFGKNFVLSFQEKEDDLFALVRQRLNAGKGRIRQRKADYLAYALVDVIVDQYYLVLDQLENKVEQLDEDVNERADTFSKAKAHQLKRQMIAIRKAILPLREAIGRFSKVESEWMNPKTTFFIRDLYDHVVQIMDSVDSYRDTLNSLQDLYLSEISFRQNKVMQLLTIITTIFVPITFLAGIYGMNFANMPELQWQYGYHILLGVMGLVVIGAVFYFKKQGWL